jgi:hypothetical protein
MQALEGHGRNEGQGGSASTEKRGCVYGHERAVLRWEARQEGQRQQKGEQNLHTGLSYAQLLDGLDEVAVGALDPRLGPIVAA